jgi:serine protease inhibitor
MHHGMVAQEETPVISRRYTRRTVLQRSLLAAGTLGLRWPVLALTRPAPAQASPARGGSVTLEAANQGFAFRLFAQLTHSRSHNTFISPLSISLAMAMVANGADGTTRQAILSSLGLGERSMGDVDRANAALITALSARDPKVQLAVANSVWIRKGLAVLSSFTQALKTFYQAPVTSLDFTDPATIGTINGWVSRQTHGLIPTILQSISPQDVLYLINTLYFHADWTSQFPRNATSQQPFTLLSDRHVAVPMMANEGMFSYFEDAQQQVIQLPYADGAFSMYILLPKVGVPYATYLERLTAQSWNATVSGLTSQHGSIALPRFTIQYEHQLEGTLSALGMKPAFDAEADFRNLFGRRTAAISAVVHKTVLKVYEAGTTAAAVTAVTIPGAAPTPNKPFSMTVDRPFFCALADDSTGTLLFMGAIVDPRS